MILIFSHVDLKQYHKMQCLENAVLLIVVDNVSN